MLKASPRPLALFKSGLRYSSVAHRSTIVRTQHAFPRTFTNTFTRAFGRTMGDLSSNSGDVRPGADQTSKKVFFFDIDNCLYPKSAKVHDRMAQLIDEYFANHLSLPWEEAVRLHKEYYQNYGLALEGLVRHHQIDPLEYNAKVDDALPLEGVIVPNPKLRQLLLDIDRSKARVWLFTNAYVTHGKRVVRLLEVEDQFEGITFCDYAKVPFVCKPHKNMFEKAMREAGAKSAEDCFFVDDSYINCKAAKELGWTAAHLVEEGVAQPETPASQFQIKTLEELRAIYPQLFKTTSGQA
ncbi:pyrimidine nucleotidase [Ophiostoma piceae UAMH 11346]|uniref:Pyrimidine nucleotidase n=1 Tax=Ophiostoma piceae (strain UAMH 11346) TaxID=1262450 RepID=S3CID9_OPHP1|nr:pyrimidine nucleotidase [Ophiostoma piceae UAMH 11346]